MSRFENLEFDDKVTRRAKAAAPGAPVRDAVYFHAEAERAYLAGDFEVALRNYSRILEQNSALFEGWFGQVRMLIDLTEYEEALLWADKALDLFPNNPELLAAKAVAANRSGAADDAMVFSDNAISRKNVTPYVWLARAEVMLTRNSRTAEHCLTNALSIAGNSIARVRLDCGRILLQSGKCLNALDYLTKAVTDLPASALAWLELGRCQAALALPAAETTLSQCLSLRPHWTLAMAALRHYNSRGLFGRIRGLFRRLFGG